MDGRHASPVIGIGWTRWLSTVLGLWPTLGGVATVVAQPVDTVIAAQGRNTAVDVRSSLRF